MTDSVHISNLDVDMDGEEDRTDGGEERRLIPACVKGIAPDFSASAVIGEEFSNITLSDFRGAFFFC